MKKKRIEKTKCCNFLGRIFGNLSVRESPENKILGI